MKNDIEAHIQRYFRIIFHALKDEDRVLKKAFSKFQDEYKPEDETGKGINDLYEHHIQYILFKAFLQRGPLLVYVEDPYQKGKGRCDLTLYDPKSMKSIWIEIKVTGWCEDWQYKKWIKSDIDKLKKIPGRNNQKYFLVTSIEDKIPDADEWEKWFKRNYGRGGFCPNLFDSFKTKFSNGKKFLDGYYTVCLLKVD